MNYSFVIGIEIYDQAREWGENTRPVSANNLLIHTHQYCIVNLFLRA